jgi:hypothetical protein
MKQYIMQSVQQDGEFMLQIYAAIILFMFMEVVCKVWLHIMFHVFAYRFAVSSKVGGT